MKKHRCTCPTLSRYPLYLRYAGTIWPSQVVRTPKIQLLSLVRLIRTLSAPPALTARQIIRSTDQTAWRVTQRKPRIDLLLPRSESCRLCLGSQGETPRASTACNSGDLKLFLAICLHLSNVWYGRPPTLQRVFEANTTAI